MSKKRIVLGIATAAALVLPLGFASPAFAEDDSTIGAQIEVVTDGAALESDGVDTAAEEERREPAAAGSVANAVSTTFGNVQVTLGKTFKPSKHGSVDRSFSVTFNGPGVTSDNIYRGYTSAGVYPTVKTLAKNKGVKSANVLTPKVYTYPSSLDPSKKNAYALTLSQYVTPGKYSLTVPVQKRTWNGSTYVSTDAISSAKTFEVHANTALSKGATGGSIYGKNGGTQSVRLTAPGYQAGAKVTTYYKAKGKKKFKKVAVSKLKAGSFSSQVNFKISKKHKLRAGGKVYFKIGGVKYAGGYKTSTIKLKKA